MKICSEKCSRSEEAAVEKSFPECSSAAFGRSDFQLGADSIAAADSHSPDMNFRQSKADIAAHSSLSSAADILGYIDCAE